MSDWTISYIVIPGEVDFNPFLSDKDKRVYGYISNLSNRYNGCNYSNKKLAILLGGCSEQTISDSISILKKYKYIFTDIVKKINNETGANYTERKITLNPKMKELYEDAVLKYNEMAIKNFNEMDIKNYKDAYNKVYMTPIKKFIVKDIIKEISIDKETSSKEEVKQTDVCNSATINNSSVNNKTIIKRRTTKQSLSENKPDWSKLHPLTNKRKEVIPLKATEDIDDILSYWNDHYKLPLPKIGTKSYNNCIKLTKVKLKNYTPDKIKEVISNFYIAATDTRYEPAKPDMKFKYQKMTLDRFIYQGFPTPYSLFDKYLEPPKMIGVPVEDLYPNITNKLISLYREEVLGKARTALSTKDINCFRRAAVMLKEFIKNNEDKFSPYMSVDDYKMARYLFECIVKSTNDESKILPHWFCAEHNINKTLPAYMYRQGILEEESRHHSPMSRFNSDGDVAFDLYDEK